MSDYAIWEGQLNEIVRRRNRRELAAAAVVTVGCIGAAAFDLHGLRTGLLLLGFGAVVVIAVLMALARPRPLADGLDDERVRTHHLTHLRDEARLLRAVPLWYVGPFLPGLAWLVPELGIHPVVVVAMAAIVFGVVLLNWRAAAHFEERVAELS